MRKFGFFLLTIACPWLVLLIGAQPGKAFAAFMLQASLLGWPLASVWAWRAVREDFLAPADELAQATTPAQKSGQKR